MQFVTTWLKTLRDEVGSSLRFPGVCVARWIAEAIVEPTTAAAKLPTGVGDPAIVLRRVSLAGTCTTGVLLLLLLSPTYRFPDGVAPNVILTFFLPLGYVLTYISYEISARYLCNWGQAAFIDGFREAVDERFKKSACYKTYRSFRGAFLSDPTAPETLRVELARSRDVRKQIAYVTAMCCVLLPVAGFAAIASTSRRHAALLVAIASLLLAIGSIVAFRVRSLTLGRAYGLAYEWADRNKRLDAYIGVPLRHSRRERPNPRGAAT